jgi:hypothetical protein
MPFTIAGIGTSFRGRRELPDGTYITTEWVTLWWVPLVPRRSWRVLGEGAGFGAPHIMGSREYQVAPVPLDRRQVMSEYFWASPAIALLGGLLALFVALAISA